MCGTKKQSSTTSSSTQTQTTQFDPVAMAQYQGLVPQYTGVWSQYMKDPHANAYFQKALARSQGNIQATGARSLANFSANTRGWGMGATPAFQIAERARMERQISGESSRNYTDLLLGFEDKRLQASSQAAGFQPLRTGETATGSSNSNTIEQTSGLGTWLPQLLAAGIGAAMPMMGGFSGLMPKASSTGYRTPGLGPSPGGLLGGWQGASANPFQVGYNTPSWSGGSNPWFNLGPRGR